MKFPCLLKTSILAFYLIFRINSVFCQNDDLVEVEVPTAKNAIAIRPQYVLFGFYGLSYERYIAGNYSIYAYAEISDGPKIFGSSVNSWVKSSMGVNDAKVYYAGYGGALGVRRYFTDKQYSLVGNKDLGALVGWFVGANIPVRKMLINVQTESIQYHNSIRQLDMGNYSFNGYIYGLGIEAGRHWVWGMFNFEINAGFTYMRGIPGNANFKYLWTGSTDDYYSVQKNLGLINFYGTFAPKFEIVMGIGF